ncbi:MAG: hypothetical protein R3B83_08265, partial [Nitrospirales bacterium]|nr:hypothetical protein [Nitrospirales bacterium]
VLSTLRAFASQGGVSPAGIEALEQQLTSLVIPALNETACALAKQHSLWSWWRVRRVIASSSTLPAEVEPLFAQIQALSKEQTKDEPAAG